LEIAWSTLEIPPPKRLWSSDPRLPLTGSANLYDAERDEIHDRHRRRPCRRRVGAATAGEGRSSDAHRPRRSAPRSVIRECGAYRHGAGAAVVDGELRKFVSGAAFRCRRRAGFSTARYRSLAAMVGALSGRLRTRTIRPRPSRADRYSARCDGRVAAA